MLVYVDNIILKRNNKNFMRQLIDILSSEFSLKDLGQLHYYCGTKVRHFTIGISLFQNKYFQNKYIRTF